MDKVGKETLETMAFAKWYNKWLYELISDHLGKDLLEIGAGTGNFTKLLLNGRKVTAIDIRDDYIKLLKEKGNDRLSVGIGDIEKGKYFFRNKRFDSAVGLNVIEHIRNDKKAIKNIYDLLDNGGKFVMLVPAHKLLYSIMDKELGHYRRYSKDEVRKMLEKAGFSVIKIRYLNWWAAIGWFLFLKLKRTNKLPKDKVRIFDKLLKNGIILNPVLI